MLDISWLDSMIGTQSVELDISCMRSGYWLMAARKVLVVKMLEAREEIGIVVVGTVILSSVSVMPRLICVVPLCDADGFLWADASRSHSPVSPGLLKTKVLS